MMLLLLCLWRRDFLLLYIGVSCSGGSDEGSIAAAAMWTRRDVKEFKEAVQQEGPNTVLRVGHGETVTVSEPQNSAQSGARRDSHGQWAPTKCLEWGTARQSRSVSPNTVLRVGHDETVTVSEPQHSA